jgi:hypothetical protein
MEGKYVMPGDTTVPGVTIFRERDNEIMRKIEMLEADNFELRNEITRLSLHNATLRRLARSSTAPRRARNLAH